MNRRRRFGCSKQAPISSRSRADWSSPAPVSPNASTRQCFISSRRSHPRRPQPRSAGRRSRPGSGRPCSARAWPPAAPSRWSLRPRRLCCPTTRRSSACRASSCTASTRACRPSWRTTACRWQARWSRSASCTCSYRSSACAAACTGRRLPSSPRPSPASRRFSSSWDSATSIRSTPSSPPFSSNSSCWRCTPIGRRRRRCHRPTCAMTGAGA